ncbi:unnamed protein product, partial [Amoebophrya sp. A120]
HFRRRAAAPSRGGGAGRSRTKPSAPASQALPRFRAPPQQGPVGPAASLYAQETPTTGPARAPNGPTDPGAASPPEQPRLCGRPVSLRCAPARAFCRGDVCPPLPRLAGPLAAFLAAWPRPRMERSRSFAPGSRLVGCKICARAACLVAGGAEIASQASRLPPRRLINRAEGSRRTSAGLLCQSEVGGGAPFLFSLVVGAIALV